MARHAWDQLPEEPAKAYSAFRLYLGMGPDRTLAKAAAKLSITLDQAKYVARRYQWAHRADEWDAWKEKLRTAALEVKERNKAATEAAAVADLARAARIQAARLLKQMKAEKPTQMAWRQVAERDELTKEVTSVWKYVEEPNPNYVESPSVVLSLVRGATELVRLIRGEPGSLEEKEKAQHREELLKRLKEMAQSIADSKGGGGTPGKEPPSPGEPPKA